MKITVKMPTGEFLKDAEGNLILDDEEKQIKERIDKEFESPFIPSKLLKKVFNVSNEIEANASDPANFDKMAGLIIQVFGWQFTREDVDEGIGSEDLILEFANCVEGIFGKMDEKMKALSDPNTVGAIQ